MLSEYIPLLVYGIILAFILGACMGSFLNCAAYRIVRGESFIKGKSHCTSCGHELYAKDLVPIISWMTLKGRCRYCGDRVSVRYPLSELAFAVITVFCLLRFDISILCLRNYVFLCCLFLLTLTDIDDMIIPDGCHITALIAWAAAEPFIFTGWRDLLTNIAAAVAFGGGLLLVSLILDHILGRESLGGGDIKLFAVCGLYLGLAGTLFALMIACVAGLLISAVRAKDTEGKEFPFGPYIAAAAAFMLLFGEPLVTWYLGLF